jgi:hypothetical protein
MESSGSLCGYYYIHPQVKAYSRGYNYYTLTILTPYLLIMRFLLTIYIDVPNSEFDEA